jgi:hemoglobin/transferrin/lactoferrin receptor protein
MEETKATVAEQVVLIDSAAISHSNAPNLADVLQQSGALFIQKSQLGGGSPVIRGFEASRVLLVIDDIRMNNLIYRGGHLQNILTVDPSVLERMEVLFGPSSTVYGSDALGGVICMRTRQPLFSSDGKTNVHGGGLVRYATAASEKTVQANASVASGGWASLTSLSFSSFGDLRMGERPGTLDSVWGTRDYYVRHVNGSDTLIANDDPFIQRNSGYDQYDLLQKFSFRSGDKAVHGIDIQFSTTSDVPRYDRLTDPSGAGLKYAEWYYGPQQRLLTAYRLDSRLEGYFSHLKAVVSYQKVRESRHTRSFGKSTRTDRLEDVNVLACTVFTDHDSERNKFQTGIDAQYSTVASSASAFNITTGENGPQSTRYPDGGNRMFFVAAYAINSQKISEKFYVEEGLRLTGTSLRSLFDDTTFFPFPFSSVEQSSLLMSGNASMVWRPSDGQRFSLVAATGFRAPNVDDLSKVFESVPGSVIVPNPELDPERTWTLELNTSTRIAKQLRWENNLYRTAFRKAIVTGPGDFNGRDSIYYDGVLSRVLKNANLGKAFLYGFNTGITAEPFNGISISGTLTYTYGRIMTDSTDAPLDHIPPIYGRVGIRYSEKRFGVEAYVLFNGRKDIKDYYLNGEDNEQYATPAGMPSWYTFNFRSELAVTSRLQLQAGVDNLLDQNYRTFASGIQAPGRNFVFSLRVRY